MPNSKTPSASLASPDPVDLDRRPMHPYKAQDGLLVDEALLEAFAEGVAAETTWDELLQHKVCLLVGPAHSGKTTELKLLRHRLRSKGGACFMLDLGTLARASVGDALGKDRSDFDEWLQQLEDGVFLLDALDEAELCDDKALLLCLGKLCASLGPVGLRRARFVVSSRPGSWSSAVVLETMREELCRPLEDVTIATGGDEAEVTLFSESSTIAKSQLTFCSLPPLTKSQASRLLKVVHGVEHPVALQDKAWSLGLGFALRSPGSLGWLARVVPKLGTGDSRSKAYEVAIGELVKMGFERRRQATNFSEDDVVQEVERLCAASFFRQTYLFSLRSAPSDDGAVSLREALSHRPATFETLLQTFPFFIDSGLQRLKLLPSELQPYLTARWIDGRMRDGGVSVEEAADLFVRNSFDGPLIPSQFEVTAGWLASMNEQFCRKVVDIAPHAVLLYGDLSGVPSALAREALSRTLSVMASGKPLLYRTVRLTSDDYWQAMRAELVVQVVAGIDRLAANEECWDLLTRLASSRSIPQAVPALKRMLTNPRATEPARVRAMDAIGECGSAEDVEWAVDVLFARGLFNARVATIALQSLLQRSRSVEHFRRVLRSGRFEAIAASVYADDVIEHHLDPTAALALVELLHGASIGIPESDAGPTMKLLVSSVKAFLSRDDVDEKSYGSLVDILEHVRSLTGDRDFDQFDDMPPLVRKRPQLQRLAIERLVKGLGSDHLWKLRLSTTNELYAHISSEDIGTLESLKSSNDEPELLAQLGTLVDGLRAHQSPRVKRVQEQEKPVAEPPPEDLPEILARVNGIADGSDGRALSILFYRATHGRGRTSLGGEHFAVLEGSHGAAVASAFRGGLRQLWRKHAPLEDANQPQTVYAQTLAGLAGLTDELQDVHAAAQLTPEEVRQALRYSLFELNRFPPWVAFISDRHFDATDAFFGEVIESWAASPAAREHAKHVVERLPDTFALNGSRCRAAVWAYLRNGACASYYEVQHTLRVLCRQPEDEDLRRHLSSETAQRWNRHDECTTAYLSAWMRVEPKGALAFLAACALDTSRHGDIVGLADHWSRNRESPLGSLDAGGDEMAEHLESLYAVVAAAAPPLEDPYRTGVFAPNARDNAGQFRSSILGMIEALGGHAAYAAAKRLSVRYQDEPGTGHALATVAVRIAEKAALPPAWSTREFVKFASDATAAPIADEQSLWLRVRRDTQSAVSNVLSGRFHIAELLKRGQERDMQLWLARELELLSRQHYSLHREGELADRTMPDLRAETPRHMVTLELKVADRRTVASLLEDLEWQLLGDYLRDRQSDFGLFVVMHQGKKQSFLLKAARLSFEDVVTRLQVRASELSSATLGKKRLEVVAFRCPNGRSPRNAKTRPNRRGQS